ncbi:hypothetical protein ZOSMA_418G00150 [Zostera marina]|uniref:Knottins-like domain-containing protein n=1 Tax=Zostera marina TaxID=29655 RepID=A0A0K9P2P6_ZOSMR|nr:hypothetical protein ZOSMA_418G00150 [Zostera marina]
MTKSQVFLMIVVTMLIAISAGMVEAVTMCYAPSKTFHGKCKDDPQGCKAACISEGFDLGPCRGEPLTVRTSTDSRSRRNRWLDEGLAFNMRMQLSAYWKSVILRLVDGVALHHLYSVKNLVEINLIEEQLRQASRTWFS